LAEREFILTGRLPRAAAAEAAPASAQPPSLKALDKKPEKKPVAANPGALLPLYRKLKEKVGGGLMDEPFGAM